MTGHPLWSTERKDPTYVPLTLEKHSLLRGAFIKVSEIYEMDWRDAQLLSARDPNFGRLTSCSMGRILCALNRILGYNLETEGLRPALSLREIFDAVLGGSVASKPHTPSQEIRITTPSNASPSRSISGSRAINATDAVPRHVLWLPALEKIEAMGIQDSGLASAVISITTGAYPDSVFYDHPILVLSRSSRPSRRIQFVPVSSK